MNRLGILRPMRVALLGLLGAAVVAAGAAAAPSRDALIRPGVGVGKVRLGMTDAQVRRALGRPQAQRRSRGAFGRLRVEYQYADGFLFVRLAGPRTALLATGVTTLQSSERTASGVGPGVLERVLRDRFASRVRCERLRRYTHHPNIPPYLIPVRKCTVSAGRTRTIFVTELPSEHRGEEVTVERYERVARVREVTVEVVT